MKPPKIVELGKKQLIGMHLEMTLANNQTATLWGQLMPRRHEILNKVDDDFYSIQLYKELFKLSTFTPNTPFTKWAAIEVQNINTIPEDMEVLTLNGLYAVFMHKGTSAMFPQTLTYIFDSWLPNSDYQIDNRAHFEVLGKKYLGHTHPDSEETVWIPIKGR